MNRFLPLAGAGIAGIATVGVLAWSAGGIYAASVDRPMHSYSQLAAAPRAPGHVYMTIATPDMLGTQVGPAMMPSSFTLPAHSDVTITITNFDDATALTGSAAQYATAQGIRGSMTVETMNPADPNAKGVTTTATSLDPAHGVSHTFTILSLGINVPLAPKSRTTFTIHTGAAGTFQWHCMDPCGTGDTGWGGAMSADGWMAGKVTVA